MRGVLEPLGRFADEVGVAVLAITHPPKAAQGSAINSFTGSLAFVAAARMAFIATEEPETERRLLLAVKNNLGSKAPGLAYRFEQRIVSKGIVGSHIAWDNAPVAVTADEALRQANSNRGKIADAKEFLRDHLSAGPVAADTITEAAEHEDISDWMLRKACKKLGVVKAKDGFQGAWVWKLPDQDNKVVQLKAPSK